MPVTGPEGIVVSPWSARRLEMAGHTRDEKEHDRIILQHVLLTLAGLLVLGLPPLFLLI